MYHHRICVILIIISSTSIVRYEAKVSDIVEHKINKREDVVNKHQRDPGKLFHQAGKLHPIPDTMANTTRLFDVKTFEGRSRMMKNHSQSKNVHGYLQLLPSNQLTHRSYNMRSQKLTPRNRHRYNSRQRMQRSKHQGDLTSMAGSWSKWFFADDSEEVTDRPRKILARHSYHRPTSYHNYPPFWPGGGNPGPNKFNSFTRFQKSRAVNHRPVTNNKINFVKKDCNSCNSVPWTPILKPSAVHETYDESHSFGDSNSYGNSQSFGDTQSYGVPTIEVHHDSTGYDTTQQKNVAPPPAPVIEHSPDSTIPASYGLPLGNIPTAHGLLPPINHVKITPAGLVPPPPTILNPAPTDGLLQSVPFPELSQVPVAPIHNSNQFLQVDTPDLVPPIPPQKSVSNVIFTISENGPGHTDSLIDNHIGQPGTIHGSDQHSDSSSFINTQLLSHIGGPYNQFNPQFGPANNHVNLDIVKSVPVAEYTSSIEYPLQIIQSPQYIDIASVPNITKSETPTYEKEPQTGSQKISDILFGLVKDSNPKNPTNNAQASGSRETQHTGQQVQTQQINHYLPTHAPLVADPPQNNFAESTQLYNKNQQYSNNIIYNQPQNPAWSQQTGGNAQQYSNPSPHQPKLEPGNDGLLPDPTSTSWLIPAQSNLAPQWILPVSNPPAIPYPLLPEDDGIASAVNGELSPTPPPQPMNDSKTKKIQIIIPYTTGNNNNKDYDQNIVESAQSEIYKTNPQWNISQPPAPKQNQNRKLPGQHVTEFSVPSNATQNSKFLNDVHHILALNIKELLKEEVEKPRTEQNIRLQKNIDNWTALEYSNHKTVAKKEPQDVISYANAVTSIPGTSISHLLLTSKKIPDKYLTTTPLPNFDEPATTHFAANSGVSVESKPFTTKSYDTSGLYSTVTRIAPTTTTITTIVKDVLKENTNHRNGYTEVVKTKANQWGKLNENLVLPENVSNRTTTTVWSNKVNSNDEKVYVVTPVSVWQSSGGDVSRRTTRQVFMTEKPELENVTISPEATKSYVSRLFGSKKSETEQVTTSPEATKSYFSKIIGSKKQENEQVTASPEATKTYITKLYGNKTERAKISKFNKPKLIQKFFATTKAPPRNITKIEIPKTKVEVDGVVETFNETVKKSINDVFPFRNGGELPLELAIAKTTESPADLVKQDSKDVRGLEKVKRENSSEVLELPLQTSTVATQNVTVVLPEGESSTEILSNSNSSAFGLKIIKEKTNATANKSKSSLPNTSKNSKAEKPLSNLPPGIFGETKRVRVKESDDDSPSGLASINETIRLLKEYLKDESDELPEEKTEGKENFKEEDRP